MGVLENIIIAVHLGHLSQIISLLSDNLQILLYILGTGMPLLPRSLINTFNHFPLLLVIS